MAEAQPVVYRQFLVPGTKIALYNNFSVYFWSQFSKDCRPCWTPKNPLLHHCHEKNFGSILQYCDTHTRKKGSAIQILSHEDALSHE